MRLGKSAFLVWVLFSFLFVKNIQANDSTACKFWVDSVFATMSSDERIGQLFIYNISAQNDKRTQATLLKVISERKVGGLLFWDGTLQGQADLTNKAQAASKVPLMVTLDGEWGLYMRLKDALRYPKKMTLSTLADENLIYNLGAEIGRQCNEMRINVDFDPVLDVNLNPENPVINTRSFGENPREIVQKAGAYIRGLHSKRILAVGKHFPGHGDTSQDSHQELAVVTHSLAQLDSIDLYPYKQLGKELDGIMVGHLSVPILDTTRTPASLSPVIVTGLLKNKMQYKGLVFTDAMKMKAVSDTKESTVKALLAGNDVILDVTNIDKEIETVKKAVSENRLSMDLINEKCKKVLTYKYQCGLNHYKPIELNGLENRINSVEARQLQEQLAQQSITIVKNKDNFLPLKNLKDTKIALISVGTEAQKQFQETLSLYDSISNYTLCSPDCTPEGLHAMDSIMAKQDVIVLSIYNTQVPDSVIAKLCENKKKVVQVYFLSPYQLTKYKLSVSRADACVLAYENLLSIQSACAQSIFGGTCISGKLPVALPGFYPKGAGTQTDKTRLGYGIPEDVGLNSNTLQHIDSIAYDAIAKGAMPGCQILVARKGVVVYQKSFGFHDYSNKILVKNTDIYDLASVTKTSSTLPMIMKLYDEQKLKLQERVSFYLPDLRKTNKRNITVLDLLTHQAGLPAFVPFYQQAIDLRSVKGKLLEKKRDSIYTLPVDKDLYANKNFTYKKGFITKLADSVHTLQVADSMFILKSFKDSVWEKIKTIPISSAKKYVYSDLSFLMLQKLAEETANEKLDKFCSDEFYKKLGATSVGFNPTRRMLQSSVIPTEQDSFLRKQLLQGYVHDQNSAFMGGVAGHAGLFANANDLAKLYQMILNGGTYGGETFLTSETCSIFTTHHSEISRRGLGFDRQEIEDKADPSKTHLLYGHTGFTGTCVWVDPKEELIYIFLSNRICPVSWNMKLQNMNVRTRIEDVIYQSIIP